MLVATAPPWNNHISHPTGKGIIICSTVAAGRGELFVLRRVIVFFQYCWWKKILHQLRLVILSHYSYRVFIHPNGGFFWDFWTINSSFLPPKRLRPKRLRLNSWLNGFKGVLGQGIQVGGRRLARKLASIKELDFSAIYLIFTYLQICKFAYILTYLHNLTHLHTYILTYLHTYIILHTYTLTYLNTYILT